MTSATALPVRIRNWETALAAYVDDLRRQQLGRFVWGLNDCATIVREGIAVMFGRDLVGESWQGPLDAHRILRRRSIAQIMFSMGGKEVPAPFARPGDITQTAHDCAFGAVSLGLIYAPGRIVTSHPDTGTIFAATRGDATFWRLPS